jgi:hypothetical protein
MVGIAERARRTRLRGSWPAFWFTTATVLLGVGIARAEKLGNVISRAGRARALAGGWYAGRHHLQVDAITTLAVAWAVVVLVAVWRTRPPHRHCLPVGLAVLSLLSFLVVRLVSLHQVDRVLDHRVHGVQVGSLIELANAVVVILLAAGTAAARALFGGMRTPLPPEAAREPLAGAHPRVARS